MNENNPPSADETWARELISKVALAAIVEQRRARRWNIFFRIVFLLCFITLTFAIFSDRRQPTKAADQHTALIKIEGLIASGLDVNADNVIKGLQAAFENEKTAGIILAINSPGGSAVQAGEIYDAIMRFRQQYPDKLIYTVASDICASGGYYIAAATHKIFANKASIIGSIGVRIDGFGFEEAIKHLGITRRLYTAGDNKGLLDPFEPVRPEALQHLQNMLNAIHQQFITAVKQGRGDRLKGDKDVFSGLVWTGEQSVALGLIDELADIRHVAENLFKAKTIVDYTYKAPLFEQLLGRLEIQVRRVIHAWLHEPILSVHRSF